MRANGLCLLWCGKHDCGAWLQAAVDAGFRVEPWTGCDQPVDAGHAFGRGAFESTVFGVLLVLAGREALPIRTSLLRPPSVLAGDADGTQPPTFSDPNEMLTWVLDNLVGESPITVVDPLAGDGALARAILESGRNLIAVESDPQHLGRLWVRCGPGVRRWLLEP